MPDNFDVNVASRKPDTKRLRPMRPWDVQPSEAVPPDPPAPDERPAPLPSIEKKTGALPEAETVQPAAGKKVSGKKKTRTPSPSKSARPVEPHDLSDSININSNYCKLHNDVSDVLFRHLSPSAQSVYLRLYRQSFGWNRNWAAESLPKLTTACNISLQTVRKAIKELESLGCIKKEFSDYHKATVYRVYLPSDTAIAAETMATNGISQNTGLNSDTQTIAGDVPGGQMHAPQISGGQVPDGDSLSQADLKNLEGDNAFSGGQRINIQSRYSLGTSIYDLLKEGGPLPKNIYKNMTNIQLMTAVDILDEFYDSIGFSIVSRSQYRKSVIDYFDLVKSGFSPDDIRYAVRWTFKNSRSRPESFSLIKHTMHLAMDDLIKELKTVSGEKELADRKKQALKRRKESDETETKVEYSPGDLGEWQTVVDDLRESINEHSFAAFIEPLALKRVKEGTVTLGAPPESASWVVDHFAEKIEASYKEKTGKTVHVEIE